VIKGIGIDEADVLPRGDGVARVFSHDLDVVIHFLSPGVI
jgi:hypothetical protein